MTTMINTLLPALPIDDADQQPDSAAAFELRHAELRIAVRQMLAALPHREAEVLRWLFGIDREATTVRATADYLGLSPAGVCKIRDRAVNKLRSFL